MTGLQSLVKGLIKRFEAVYKVLLYTQIQNKRTSQRIEGMTKILRVAKALTYLPDKKKKKEKST